MSRPFQEIELFRLAEEIQGQRMLKFGSAKVPKLSKVNLVNTEVHLLIQYIHRLLSQEAFDDSVMGNLIDNETITLLGYVFAPTETASRNPITTHWTIDWAVATIIEALEELYRSLWITLAASSRQVYQ